MSSLLSLPRLTHFIILVSELTRWWRVRCGWETARAEGCSERIFRKRKGRGPGNLSQSEGRHLVSGGTRESCCVAIIFCNTHPLLSASEGTARSMAAAILSNCPISPAQTSMHAFIGAVEQDWDTSFKILLSHQ